MSQSSKVVPCWGALKAWRRGLWAKLGCAGLPYAVWAGGCHQDYQGAMHDCLTSLALHVIHLQVSLVNSSKR